MKLRTLYRFIFLTAILGDVGFATAQQAGLLIGPGDVVHIQVLDTPELEQTARVGDQGNLPLLVGGAIHLAGLTPETAARAIENTLKTRQIMYEPHVLVSVSQYATGNVSVFGQVVRPGSYPINTTRSIIDVLSLAGGFTDLADRTIVIERAGTAEHVKVLIPNNPDNNGNQAAIVQVNPGDRVIVPKVPLIYVLGDVGRAGGYPMNDNHSRITLLQALAAAGGAHPTASADHARLVRRTADGYTEMPIKLEAMQKGKIPDQIMQPDDVIYVPFSFLRQTALGLTGILTAVGTAAVYTRF